MDHIGGRAWSIRELFGRRFVLNNYQREYQWETSHLQDLINDLSTRYLKQRKPEHELRDVETFDPYFLGPIVTHRATDATYVVDGQQRITTLMLLLIWLHRLQSDRDDAVPGLDTLVVTHQYDRRIFVVEDLVVPREPVLSALLYGQPLPADHPRSVSEENVVDRFEDLDELFPLDLQDDDLPFFISWLLDRVILMEISTEDAALAFETFETMNDRGLRLNAADLLKSFVLQSSHPADRAKINVAWRDRVARLTAADSNGDTAFIKAWLRAKYSRHAADDDAIGSGFNRWVRSNHGDIGIRFPGEFGALAQQMDRLGDRYLRLVEAARKPQPHLEPVYFNGLNSVTLQYPLILAAVSADDALSTFVTKARMIAGFLDILVARRLVNGQDYRYDSLSHTVFALAREIRDLDPAALAVRLGEEVAALPESFEGIASYGLRHGNRAKTKHLLARITAWLQVMVDTNPDGPTEADVVRQLWAHDIEHIWANRPEYQPQVPTRRFQAVRNRLGALVLLPRSLNAAIGDRPYADKYGCYLPENLLAGSLHPDRYRTNPRFRAVCQEHKLPFQSYEVFDEAAIEQRQRLYRRLCELVWEPSQYGLVLPKQPRAPKRYRTGRVTVARLIEVGLVAPESRVVAVHNGSQYTARLTADGHFVLESGETFTSPTSAAAAVLDRPSWPGWRFWRVEGADGTSVTLETLRRMAS